MKTRLEKNLKSLSMRFHGFDLQFRRDGSGWEKPWRARMHSTKNERDNYRLTAYGKTPSGAVTALQKMVGKQDKEVMNE